MVCFLTIRSTTITLELTYALESKLLQNVHWEHVLDGRNILCINCNGSHVFFSHILWLVIIITQVPKWDFPEGFLCMILEWLSTPFSVLAPCHCCHTKECHVHSSEDSEGRAVALNGALGTKCKRAGSNCRHSDDGQEARRQQRLWEHFRGNASSSNLGTLLQTYTEAKAGRGQGKRKFKGSFSLGYTEFQASTAHSKTYVLVRL